MEWQCDITHYVFDICPQLTACVHGSAAMLYPMHWQHVYIPVLPQHLLDYCWWVCWVSPNPNPNPNPNPQHLLDYCWWVCWVSPNPNPNPNPNPQHLLDYCWWLCWVSPNPNPNPNPNPDTKPVEHIVLVYIYTSLQIPRNTLSFTNSSFYMFDNVYVLLV